MPDNIQCPKCKQYKTQTLSFYGCICIAMSSCLIWLGFLFPPFWIFIPIFFLIAIIIWGIDLNNKAKGKPRSYFCQNCYYTFKK